MKNFSRLLSLVILFISTNSWCQWTQTAGPFGALSNGVIEYGNYVFNATWGNGVYRSNDKGLSWKECNNGFNFLAVQSIVATDKNLFAVSGSNAWSNHDPFLIYISKDSGYKWEPMAANFFGSWPPTLVSNGDNLYALFGTDLCFYSKDQGIFWDTLKIKDEYCDNICFYHNYSFASTGIDNYISLDGINWRLLNKFNKEKITQALSIGDSLIVVTYKGIYFSLDSGYTWSSSIWNTGITDNYIYSSCIQNNVWYVNANQGFYTSVDHGRSWQISTKAKEYEIQREMPLYGTSYGVYAHSRRYGQIFLHNNGEIWIACDSGITNHTVTKIVTHQNTLWAATDMGIFSSIDNGIHWNLNKNQINAASTPISAKLFSDDKTLYAFSDQIYFSDDNGNNWKRFGPVTQGSIYDFLVFNNQYISCSFGVNKYNFNIGRWDSVGLGEYQINCLTSFNGLLYAGCSISGWSNSAPGGLFYSKDSGSTWVPLNEHMPTLNINSLYVSNDKIILGTLLDGIYISNDNWKNWQDATHKLLDSSIWSIVVIDGVIFASTDFGIYSSKDNGISWKYISPEIPKTKVFTLASDNNYLYAGTQYQGIWRCPLQQIVGIAKVDLETIQIKVYPNPASHNLTISFDASFPIDKIEINSTSGISFPQTSLVKSDNSISFDISKFSNGVYFVTLHSGEKRTVKKVIKI